MIERTYLIKYINDPNSELGAYYMLCVLNENKQQVFRANSAYHHLILEKIVERQKGIDMNKKYILVDESFMMENQE